MLLVSFGLSGSFKENQKYRKDASNATILWHSRIDLQSDYCDSKVRSIDVSETKDTTVARTFFFSCFLGLLRWQSLDKRLYTVMKLFWFVQSCIQLDPD